MKPRRRPFAGTEPLVVNRIRLFLSDGANVLGAIAPHVQDPSEQTRLLEQAVQIAATWPDLAPTRARLILRAQETNAYARSTPHGKLSRRDKQGARP
jgi:hypothetical protein